MFKLKRVYEEPSPEDGFRVLVERLWPRRSQQGAGGTGHVAQGRGPEPGAPEMVQPRPGQVGGVPGALCGGTQGGQRGPGTC